LIQKIRKSIGKTEYSDETKRKKGMSMASFRRSYLLCLKTDSKRYEFMNDSIGQKLQEEKKQLELINNENEKRTSQELS
jgi:alpha-galactosidase/6-phospho-beta-glucosidase family protein